MSARYTGGLVYNAPGGWSGYFDGSGDWITAPSNAAFGFGTGDFTIEGWLYWTGGSGENTFFCVDVTNGANIFLNSSSNWGIGTRGVSINNNFGTPPTQNVWNHLSVSRSGSTIRAFINGVQVFSGSNSTSYATGSPAIAAIPTASGNIISGYISNLRVLKGTALYTAAFTPPNGPLQAIANTSLLTCRYPTFVDGSSNAFTLTVSGNTVVNTLNPFPTSQLPNPALGGAGNGVYTMSQYAALKAANLWPAFDPFYRNVTLNLHGNGTNAAQNNTFLDSSTNNFTITRNGNTTQGTFTPYGPNWSNVFNASTDRLTLSGPNLSSYTDFTFECWVNFNGFGSDTKYFLAVSGGSYYQLVHDSSAGISLRVTGYTSVVGQSSNSGWSIGTWYHVALVKSGSIYTIYRNGVSIATSTYTSALPSVTIGYIGGYDSTTGLNAYMSNTRITSTAVYTAAFTPPTAPLTAITNTLLLTSQSNRFVDNSASPYTLTVSGTPSVQRFSPFSPTTAYSTNVIGGSGYFDGSGDYLGVTGATTALAFGSGDFTIEFWGYILQTTPEQMFIDWRPAGTQTTQPLIYVTSAGVLAYYVNAANRITGATLVTNQWYHIAVSRSGTSTKMFLNGVQTGSTWTDTTVYTNTSTRPLIGLDGNTTNSGYLKGNVTDVRTLTGTALYTTTFTPPTAPLTAITNTSLLLSTTNAGILDNAMMTDWETAGSAQISTSVVKYGTGSIALDGTGDYLSTLPTRQLDFGTGNFTLEMWLNLNTVSAVQVFVNFGFEGSPFTQRSYVLYLNSDNTLHFAYSTDGSNLSDTSFGASGITTGTWNHLAIVRNGSTITAYRNGTAYATTINIGTSPIAYAGGLFRIGTDATNYTNGYIDDLRITKGVARYTGNFTPPTSQVQDQ
jgi:hypothetical protein